VTIQLYSNIELDFETNTQKKNHPQLKDYLYRSVWNNIGEQHCIWDQGTIPQQEFTYLEVGGRTGVYTWNDYNNNGIQELQEFEVAPLLTKHSFKSVFT
jgi:hypothetical protein